MCTTLGSTQQPAPRWLLCNSGLMALFTSGQIRWWIIEKECRSGGVIRGSWIERPKLDLLNFHEVSWSVVQQYEHRSTWTALWKKSRTYETQPVEIGKESKGCWTPSRKPLGSEGQGRGRETTSLAHQRVSKRCKESCTGCRNMDTLGSMGPCAKHLQYSCSVGSLVWGGGWVWTLSPGFGQTCQHGLWLKLPEDNN